MKNKIISRLLFVSMIFSLFTACRRTDIPEPNGENIVVDVAGYITNENGQPLAGAMVHAGGKEAYTDQSGFFSFDDVKLCKELSFVSCTRYGYFDGSRTFKATEGKANFISIQMIPRSQVGNLVAADGGTVTFDGVTLTFPSDGFADKNTGAAYNGSVFVDAAYLSPTDAALSNKMPGMLYGLRSDETTRGVLLSKGMINVELYGSSGQKLQIADGKSVSIKIPAIAGIDNPTTVPLWYFDVTSGIWKEEGEATLNNGFYEGTVAHFSWWNCDAFANRVNLTFRVLNGQGDPIQAVGTRLTVVSSGFVGNQWTDQNGIVTGLVPANEALILEIYDVCSGTVVTTVPVGPFGSDTNLGDFTANITSSMVTILLEGNVVDCNGQPLSGSGIDTVLFYINSGLTQTSAFTFVTNGSYSQSVILPACALSSIQVYGYTYSNSFAIALSIPQTQTQMPTLVACNSNANNHLTLSIDNGVAFSIDTTNFEATAETVNDTLNFHGLPNYIEYIDFNLQNNTVDGFYLMGGGNPNGQYYMINGAANTLIINQQANNIGEFFDATCTGTMYSLVDNQLHNINLNIHVQRTR